MERQTGTHDLTPTWHGLIPLLTEVALNGTSPEGRDTARAELTRLAKIADASREVVDALSALVDQADVECAPEIVLPLVSPLPNTEVEWIGADRFGAGEGFVWTLEGSLVHIAQGPTYPTPAAIDCAILIHHELVDADGAFHARKAVLAMVNDCISSRSETPFPSGKNHVRCHAGRKHAGELLHGVGEWLHPPRVICVEAFKRR